MARDIYLPGELFFMKKFILKQKNPDKSPRSLFFYLVFILIFMAIFINFTVFFFFHMMRKETFRHPVKMHIEQYTGYIAREIGDPPDFKKMKKICEKLHLRIYYQSRDLQMGYPDSVIPLFLHKNFFGHNETDGWIPGHFVKTYKSQHGVFTFILDGPDALSVIPRRVVVLIMVLSLMFIFAWVLLKKLLWPLKEFESAYARVGQGNLDLKLEISHPREFVKMGNGFNSMLESIRKMLDGRQQLLRDISHELRTPLTRIKMNLSFLKMSKERSAIEEDIQIMGKLIDEILETYRLSGNKIQLNRVELDIVETIDKTIEYYKKSDPDRIIHRVASPGKIILKADNHQLVRLFSNLMENSIKHGNPDSEINIDISRDQNEFICKIFDGGAEVPEIYREKLFEPFFQVEPDRNPARSGYGLGLFICRRIVEEHGGLISYEKDPKGDFCFAVRLPLD